MEIISLTNSRVLSTYRLLESRFLAALLVICLSNSSLSADEWDPFAPSRFTSPACQNIDFLYSENIEKTPLSFEKFELSCQIVSSTLNQLRTLLSLPVHIVPELVALEDAEFLDHPSLPAWTKSVTVDGKIVLSENLLYSEELRRTLVHETVHLFIFKVSGTKVPAWLEEGLAQVISSPSESAPDKFRNNGEFTKIKGQRLANLSAGFHHLPDELVQSAYFYSEYAVRTLVRRKGFSGLSDYLTSIANGLDHEVAFEEAFGVSEDAFDRSL